MLLGAVIGDIAGSRFERHNYRSTDFELFDLRSTITDDTVCTVAVAEWIAAGGQDDLVPIMRRWCRGRYFGVGYGRGFYPMVEKRAPCPVLQPRQRLGNAGVAGSMGIR